VAVSPCVLGEFEIDKNGAFINFHRRLRGVAAAITDQGFKALHAAFHDPVLTVRTGYDIHPANVGSTERITLVARGTTKPFVASNAYWKPLSYSANMNCL
jgi:hypothetical protein